MLVDDPVPVETGHWEINNAFTLTHSANSNEFELPLEDINYGVSGNEHIKFEIPFVVRQVNGSPYVAGLGKASIGTKWRFYDNKQTNISISVYPQISFNILSNSVSKGITEEGFDFLIPCSFMIQKNRSSVILELGRQFSTRDQGIWIFGSLYDMILTKKVDLAVELYGESEHNFDNPEVFLNAGGRVKLSNQFNLLMSAGNNFVAHPVTDNTFIAYLGLQLEI